MQKKPKKSAKFWRFVALNSKERMKYGIYDDRDCVDLAPNSGHITAYFGQSAEFGSEDRHLSAENSYSYAMDNLSKK